MDSPQAKEQARLAALYELEILDSAPEPDFDDVVALAAALCDTPIAIINFVDADRQWGKALIGVESSEAPRHASFCARTITQDTGVLVVPDTLNDPVGRRIRRWPVLRVCASTPAPRSSPTRGTPSGRCAWPMIGVRGTSTSASWRGCARSLAIRRRCSSGATIPGS